MEHRHSKRNAMQQSVVVDCPGMGLMSAKIGDISADGMFVQTDGPNFPLDTPVFVAFDLPAGTYLNEFGLEAKVVRHTPSGVGLMFLEVGTGIGGALHLALYGAPIAAPAKS